MKSKYETHVEPNLDLIESWREEGISEENIAKQLGVAYSTFKVYKGKHKALSAILLKTKKKLVAKLKKTLWKEALGYKYEEKQEIIEAIMDENGNITNKKKVKRTVTTKYARPVPALVQFALCNLAPELFARVDKDIAKSLKDLEEKTTKNNGISAKKLDKMLDVLYSGAIKEKETKNNDK